MDLMDLMDKGGEAGRLTDVDRGRDACATLGLSGGVIEVGEESAVSDGNCSVAC